MILAGGHTMKKSHHSPLLVAALVCGIAIPPVMWAQEGEVRDSHVLPSGFTVKFERRGGYLGTYSVFWIYPDGQVINGLGETVKIPSDIVEQWVGTISPPDRLPLPYGLKEFPMMGSLCFDCSTYQITIYDKNGTRVRGFFLSSGEVEKTFPGIITRLQRGIWSPLMREPDDPDLPRRVRRPPIKVGGNVQESKLIRRVEPVYPELAKTARVQGRVVLVVTVDEEGSVAEIKVTNGHPLLDEAAVTAVRQWKYSPTLLNGEPVPVIATVTVTFSFTASGDPAISVGGQVE
jgi:TonB family protein